MLRSALITFSTALLATVGIASSDQSEANGCDTWDSKTIHCYDGEGDNAPQELQTDDILRAATYLREYGMVDRNGGYWTMTAKEAPDCAEWTVYKFRSVHVIAKHINSKDSKVLYTDIANTIDGGEDGEELSIYTECEGRITHNGGSFGVQFNPSDPAYHTEEFTNGTFTPKGIVIKLRHNTDDKEKKEEL